MFRLPRRHGTGQCVRHRDDRLVSARRVVDVSVDRERLLAVDSVRGCLDSFDARVWLAKSALPFRRLLPAHRIWYTKDTRGVRQTVSWRRLNTHANTSSDSLFLHRKFPRRSVKSTVPIDDGVEMSCGLVEDHDAFCLRTGFGWNRA